jgi:prepilin-type N-terminal cleavage/methylation domain-containing protein
VPGTSAREVSRDRRAAFTLVESLIALTILAVGLLAMLGLQFHAISQASWGRHGTQAAVVVRNQIETFNRLDWADAQLQPTDWTAPVVMTTMVQSPQGGQQEQSFDLSWRITADGTNTTLRHIDVRAMWREPNQRPASPARRYAVSSMRYNN